MPRRDELYLEHIRQAAYKIVKRLHGVSREDFDADDEKQDGIIRQLEIIGEAAAQVSDAVRVLHPRVDWQGMEDLRNNLIDGYPDVNTNRVWGYAQHVPIWHAQVTVVESWLKADHQSE